MRQRQRTPSLRSMSQFSATSSLWLEATVTPLQSCDFAEVSEKDSLLVNVEFAGGESCPGRGCKGANIHTNSFSDYETIATKGTWVLNLKCTFPLHTFPLHTLLLLQLLFSLFLASHLLSFSSFPCSDHNSAKFNPRTCIVLWVLWTVCSSWMGVLKLWRTQEPTQDCALSWHIHTGIATVHAGFSTLKSH